MYNPAVYAGRQSKTQQVLPQKANMGASGTLALRTLSRRSPPVRIRSRALLLRATPRAAAIGWCGFEPWKTSEARLPPVPYSVLRALRSGKREVERRALSGLGFGPDSTTVAFHDPLTHRQSDASPGMLVLGVESLEHLEDTIHVLGINTDPFVPNGYAPLAPLALGRDVYPRGIVTAVLDRVAQEVLKHLP